MTKTQTALVMIAMAFGCTPACTSAQIKADEAKATACVESPAFVACAVKAVKTCDALECTKVETDLAVLACARVCKTSTSDAGEAGAPGDAG